MPNTPLGLPYPSPTDPVSLGANDIRALAEAVEAYPPLLTPAQFPPANPINGQRVRLLVDAASGIEWELVYRAASPNAEKWEFLGGPPLSGFGGAEVVPGLDQWWGLGPPILTVPKAGYYVARLEFDIWISSSSAVTLNASFDNAAIPPAGYMQATNAAPSTADGGAVYTTSFPLTTGQQLGGIVKVNSYSVRFWGRSLQLTPIRLG